MHFIDGLLDTQVCCINICTVYKMKSILILFPCPRRDNLQQFIALVCKLGFTSYLDL